MPLPRAIFGFKPLQKFGKASAVTTTEVTAQNVVVWALKNGGVPFPAAVAATTIVSDSVEDDPGGAGGSTGAWTVNIQGVTSAYRLFSVDVTLDGTTPVDIGVQALRVFRVKVLTKGTADTNVGTLTVSAGGSSIASVEPEIGQTEQAAYTVPDDYSALYLSRWAATATKSATTTQVEIGLEVREFGGAWQRKETMQIQTGANAAPPPHDWDDGLYIPSKADIRVVIFDLGASGLDIEARFYGQLHQRSDLALAALDS